MMLVYYFQMLTSGPMSSDSEMLKTSSEPLEDINQLIEWAMDSKYYKVLDSVTDEMLYFNVDHRDLLAVGFSLIELKRYQEGMMQCALAIEICSFEERPAAMFTTALLCEKARLYDISRKLFQETYQTVLAQMEEESERKENLLSECLTHFKTCTIVSTTKLCNEKQLQTTSQEAILRYLQAGGTLSGKIFTMALFEGLKQNSEIQQTLLKWANTGTFAPLTTSQLDPLELLFNSIISHAPEETFEPLLQIEQELQVFIMEELSKYPEIDDSIDTKYVTKVLEKIRHSSATRFLKLCGLIIKIKTIKSYFQLLQQEYIKSYEGFRWLVIFIPECNKKLKGAKDNNWFSKKVKMAILNLCGQAFVGLPRHLQSYEEADGIKTMLVLDADETMSHNDQFFHTLGLLSEKMAVLSSTAVQMESEQISFQHADNKLLCLPRSHLDDMIRKEIIAAVLKPDDDFRMLECYDRILWGLLLYGGIHIKTIWFFNFLKEYYKLKKTIHPITMGRPKPTCGNEETEPFKSKSQTCSNDNNNFRNTVDLVYRMKESILRIESKDMWNASHGSAFLVPQAFMTEKNTYRIILSDEFFDDSSQYGNNKTFVIGKAALRATRKLRGHLKLQQKFVVSQLQKSREYIVFWLDCFKDLHPITAKHTGSPSIPKPIANFLTICLD